MINCNGLDLYQGNIRRRNSDGTDELVTYRENIVYMEEEDAFITTDNYLIYIFSPVMESEKYTKEELEEIEKKEKELYIPYAKIGNFKKEGLYIDEDSIINLKDCSRKKR